MIKWEDICPEDIIRMQQETEGPPDEWEEDREPYFRDDEDRCPRMGMQGVVIRTRRRLPG